MKDFLVSFLIFSIQISNRQQLSCDREDPLIHPEKSQIVGVDPVHCAFSPGGIRAEQFFSVNECRFPVSPADCVCLRPPDDIPADAVIGITGFPKVDITSAQEDYGQILLRLPDPEEKRFMRLAQMFRIGGIVIVV